MSARPLLLLVTVCRVRWCFGEHATHHTLRPALEQVLSVADGQYHQTPAQYALPLEDLSALAGIPGAGDARGPRWYDYKSVSEESEIGTYSDGSSLSLDKEKVIRSSEASSRETRERKRRKRVYRECTACPLDMVRKHSNYGIKWICGAYQRARRTFKSECMMRYRNCQDGTMFVKVSDRRCPESPFHGKHWFYVYRI